MIRSVNSKKGKRDDLVSQTENEIKVLQQYLPAPLSDQELQELVAQVISELNANGLKDMGKVMGKLSAQTKGRVDGGKLAAIVKEKLGAQ